MSRFTADLNAVDFSLAMQLDQTAHMLGMMLALLGFVVYAASHTPLPPRLPSPPSSVGIGPRLPLPCPTRPARERGLA